MVAHGIVKRRPAAFFPDAKRGKARAAQQIRSARAKKAAYKRVDALNNWSHIFGTHDLFEEAMVEIDPAEYKKKQEEAKVNEDGDNEELEVEVVEEDTTASVGSSGSDE